MLIQPKIRGFICTTAHPLGCARAVEKQIEYIQFKGHFNGPIKVLIIGASTGYGLASRIAVTFGAGAKTIGVFYEKEADEKRTASPGWYNTAAFETKAHQAGYYAKSINGDAFSNEIKEQAGELIRKDLGQVDLVIYSLASPRRIHPFSKQIYSSVLKPIGQSFQSKTIDAFRQEVKEVTLESASAEEIANTVAVMGGEDWEMWIDYLNKEKLLAPGCLTVAYSYIGPQLTYAIYKDGTIGKAKEHLKMTADLLNKKFQSLKGKAIVSVNKAVVTQASAAIPVVPLYISLLFKIMKEKNLHEGCIQQIYRLFKENLYTSPIKVDAEGYIRVDDWEMREDVQRKIKELWPMVTSENLQQLADVQGYCEDFYQLFGFHLDHVDYNLEVDPMIQIESLRSS